MILVLITIVLWIIYGVSAYKRDTYYSRGDYYWRCDTCATVSIILASLFSAVCIIVALCCRVGADNRIAQNDIQYKSLCKRLEIINSDYEDVSKSDVIADVAEWNKNVVDCKYWANNPWTSWLCSQEVADHLQMIEY